MLLLDSLLKEAIEYQDISSSFGYSDKAFYKISNLKDIYPNMLSKKILGELFSKEEIQLKDQNLSAFILDNISYSIDFQFNNNYIDAIGSKNDLAKELGYDNYFELYSKSRGFTSYQVELDAYSTIAATQYEYSDLIALLPRQYNSSKEGLYFLAELINSLKYSRIDAFFNSVDSFLDKLKLLGVKSSFKHPYKRYTLAFNISKKTSTIHMIKSTQLEDLRAFFHILGHVFYFIQNLNNPSNILTSDSIRSESWAVFFENSITSNDFFQDYFLLPESIKDWQRFLILYYIRLYAFRILFEKKVYENKINDKNKLYKNLYVSTMKLKDGSNDFLLDEKPVCIDFFYANKNYFSKKLEENKQINFYIKTLQEILQ